MPTRAPIHRPAGWRPPEQRIREYDERRGSPDQRGYDTAWKRVRLAFLQANPICRDCQAAGRVTAAREVHHIERVRDRPDRRLDPSNLMGLCTPCHSARTGRGE
jgi:5-methylcytosine-specific restriction protein A